MMPHALMGIRVRGCRFIRLWGGGAGGGGKHVGRMTSMSAGVMGMLSAFGMGFTKMPFYRKLFTQRRKG